MKRELLDAIKTCLYIKDTFEWKSITYYLNYTSLYIRKKSKKKSDMNEWMNSKEKLR